MSMNANTKTTITLDSGDKAQFILEQDEYSTKVYFLGTYLGEIESYEGSLDRYSNKGRIRIPGKPRTLWAAKSNTDTRTSFKFKTRGDALRYLSRSAVI